MVAVNVIAAPALNKPLGELAENAVTRAGAMSVIGKLATATVPALPARNCTCSTWIKVLLLPAVPLTTNWPLTRSMTKV